MSCSSRSRYLDPTMAEADIVIDARGLRCPEPVLRLRATLREAAPGTRVRLLATDPLAPVDVEAYCLRASHRLLDSRERDGAFEFWIERG